MTEPRMRAILPLLKARITARSADGFTISFGPEYGSPTTIRISMPTARFDLRDGDILTLYTEVLINAPANPTTN
jgi:hypothetical protein